MILCDIVVKPSVNTTQCLTIVCICVERGSLVEECQTQSGEPVFEAPRQPFRGLDIFFISTMPQFSQLYKCVPGYRRWYICE